MFCKEGVLRNFAKLTEKHLCQSLFFNKVAGLRPGTVEALAQVFPCEFCEVSKSTFSTEHLRWLLLFMEINSLKCILNFQIQLLIKVNFMIVIKRFYKLIERLDFNFNFTDLLFLNYRLQSLKAVARMCSVKKVLLEIS